ncbi:MAG: hypothetical protein ACK520_06335, partial [Inhella sp.]
RGPAPAPPDPALYDRAAPQRNAGAHHVGQAARAQATDVAAAGVDLLLGQGLLRVVGWTNRLMVLSNRFVPRSLVATVSKRLLRPLDLRAGKA